MSIKHEIHRNRGTIFVEESSITSVKEFPDDQFVVRLYAPKCAAHASAGSFAHVQCDKTIPMRRPLSIMRANAAAGWVEFLFKIVGDGLLALSKKQVGDKVSIIGPIGHGFEPNKKRSRVLMIGGGVGIPPMIYLAETLKNDPAWEPLVMMGSEVPFPFDMTVSAHSTPWLADGVNKTIALLEGWNVPARLASRQGFSGCYNGYVTGLAEEWLDTLTIDELQEVEIFSCGPAPMLGAVAALARNFNTPCQISLEEYMACAVGGCAGCTVPVKSSAGLAMRRVCVDGPVFDATAVFPE